MMKCTVIPVRSGKDINKRIEENINKWLSQNPNIKIITAVQTMVAGFMDETLMTTIFYE